jgi:hypothetical protein
MRKNLTPDSFLREALGIWDADPADGAEIDSGVWQNLGDRNADLKASSPVTIAVAVSKDRRWSSIGVAGSTSADRRLVMVQSERGTAWVVPALVGLRDKHNPVDIALDPASNAGALIADLEDAGVDVTLVNGREMAQACGSLLNAIDEGELVHTKQPELDVAVSVARTRDYAEAVRWDARGPVDISPLNAVTIALHRFRLTVGADYDLTESYL